MISDQRVGLGGKVVSGTPKDTLHFVDLVFNPDNDRRPEVLIIDQGSYSDIRKHINVHGHYSFQLPDLGGQWRELRDPDHQDPDHE